MNRIRPAIVGAIIMALALVAGSAFAAVNIVPKPKTLTLGNGTFTVPAKVLFWAAPDPTMKSDTAIAWLKSLFYYAGKDTQRVADSALANVKVVYMATVPDTSVFGTEGYSLIVNTKIIIQAPTSIGLFYAVMSLRQMMPAEIELKNRTTMPATITFDQVTILDKPRYQWRSTQLDPARSWIPLDYLYKTADRLALFKMNILHLHLTDDQGWRIEIPRYPNLTVKGASTQIGGATPPSGTRWYYSQQEMKDFSKYCADRKIYVIPEVDMPGHMQAAIASYPQWGVLGSTAVRTTAGISADYLKNNAEVDTFIAEVWRQMDAIFPRNPANPNSNYLHIGGDECTSTSLADYATFIRKVEQQLKKLGRSLVGWEEINQTYGTGRVIVEPTSTYVPWTGTGPGGVVAWCNRLYFDMCNKTGDPNCYTWCSSQIPLQTVYLTPMTNGGATCRGFDCPLWGEMLSTFGLYNDRQLWPRVTAAVEMSWVPTGTNTATTWTNDFRNRIATFGCRFDRMGMKWYTADGVITWPRCAVTASAVSVSDGFVPNVLPSFWSTSVKYAWQKHGPDAIASGDNYQVFDLKGRLVTEADGKNIKTMTLSKKSADGIYFVMDKKNRLVSQIVK